MAQKPGIIRENIPHTVILSFWLLCIFLGALSDTGSMGAYLAQTAGAAASPSTLILSVAFGFIPDYRKFLIAALVVVPGNMTFDYYQRKEWLAKLGYSPAPDELFQLTIFTGLAMITVLHAVNFIVRCIVRKDENA